MPADIYHNGNAEHIVPASLPINLDKGLLKQSFYELEAAFEGQQGLAALVSSLAEKTASFRRLLLEDQQPLTDARMVHLVEQMFTARRKIWPVIEEQGAARVGEVMRDLLGGHGDLAQRMMRFEEALPATGKAKRVIRDMGAELLHFSDPERYPLMTRWVWDQSTNSGAVREFIRGGDYLTDFPFQRTARIICNLSHDERPPSVPSHIRRGLHRFCPRIWSSDGTPHSFPFWPTDLMACA